MPGSIGLELDNAGYGRTPLTGWLILRRVIKCVPLDPT